MDSEAKDQEKSHFLTSDWRFQNQWSIVCRFQPNQMINSYFSSSFLNNVAGIFLQNQSHISIDPSFALWEPRSSSSNGINLNEGISEPTWEAPIRSTRTMHDNSLSHCLFHTLLYLHYSLSIYFISRNILYFLLCYEFSFSTWIVGISECEP